MKGIILAGGNATRLRPLTLVTNKHLLPIYNKPLIYYPIETMVRAGINRIMIITSPHHLSHFVNLLGSGHDFKDNQDKQIQIVYAIQNDASGIADGLWIARDYVGNDSCMLLLGDNIFIDDLSPYLKKFKTGAMVFLKDVHDPERFGIAEVDTKGRVVSVEEKPKKPKSNLAITGAYVYDTTCFKKCVGQPKSKRGEYEITYINNLYLQAKQLKAVHLQNEWFDAGTFDSLIRASLFVQAQHKHHEPVV